MTGQRIFFLNSIIVWLGGAFGYAASTATVLIVRLIGFTCSGVAAGSMAAGMMSAAGNVAAGSVVATLQSIGVVGLAPAVVTGFACTGAILGAGVAAIIKTCRSSQRESLSGYERGDSLDKYWIIATEEGCGNVRVCRYLSESDARVAFNTIWCCRILYSPQQIEIKSGGWNGWALDTIRRVINEHYFGSSAAKLVAGSSSGYERGDSLDKYWIIATEEGCGNVRVYRYLSESDARVAFNTIWCCRILYSPQQKEIKSGGWNGWALDTIRRFMKEHYFQE